MSGFAHFVTHLECTASGEAYPAGEIHNLSAAGKPLFVRYDLTALKAHLTKDALQNRKGGFWRYREFLPLKSSENMVSFDEGVTPLVSCPNMAAKFGLQDGNRLLIKDESRFPTGSFKARGLSVAISMAKELGIKRIAMPTNGNAGGALSAYASRAGIESFIFCPELTPEVNVQEMVIQGAKVFHVNGYISDCGRIVGEGKEKMGWFDASTLKEPYRVEGKKTTGIEIAEQLGWELPDVILYPAGGGTCLIGMWKAFLELQEIGWISGELPRMVAVQSAGCAPIVKAYEEGKMESEPWENAATGAAGIRVPVVLGDFIILGLIRDSNGFAIAVSEEDINSARLEMGKIEGFHMCPEGAATYAAYKQALEDGRIGKDEQVVIFNTGSGLKYPIKVDVPFIDCTQSIDYDQIAGA